MDISVTFKMAAVADAEAFRISKEAEAQAIANQLSAKSVTDDLIRYNAIGKWNGA